MDPRVLKALIVDDEPIARRVLREDLELLPNVEVVGEADNGKDALLQIEKLKPDAVFLDLQMPVMSGFEVVRNLSGTNAPVVVIVTAFDQHAIQAFEAGAVDYLLKPVNEARLRTASDRKRPEEVRHDAQNCPLVPCGDSPKLLRDVGCRCAGYCLGGRWND
jgi:DNA-binding LytR/AlgR family response regulator